MNQNPEHFEELRKLLGMTPVLGVTGNVKDVFMYNKNAFRLMPLLTQMADETSQSAWNVLEISSLGITSTRPLQSKISGAERKIGSKSYTVMAHSDANRYIQLLEDALVSSDPIFAVLFLDEILHNDDEKAAVIQRCIKVSQFAKEHNGLYNTIVVVGNSLPAEIRAVNIPLPTTKTRESYISMMLTVPRYASLKGDKSYLVKNSEGLRLAEVRTVLNMSVCERNAASAMTIYRYGVPTNYWNELSDSQLTQLEQTLMTSVIGQEKALKPILQGIRAAASPVLDAYKKKRGPRFVGMLVGPPGVGKTETARCLAKAVFGDERSLVRIDLQNYSLAHTKTNLVGSPKSYVGHNETPVLDVPPFSVVAFDEVEKAHPEILTLLLGILDSGNIELSNGKKVDFSQTIVLFTSNLGAKKLQKGISYEAGRKLVMDAVEQHFNDISLPELLSRIGKNHVYYYGYLSPENSKAIAQSLIKDFRDGLKEKQIMLQITPAAMEKQLDRVSALCDGRSVSKFVEDHVVIPISNTAGRRTGQVTMDYDGKKFHIYAKG